ncbi:MAG: hypothetical protein AAGI52_09785 [Bacteroidota bacterium]
MIRSARLFAFALLTLLLTGCSTIRSTIGIPPGETFVLGGGQDGAFSAELLNVGDVTVGVSEVTVTGDTLALSTLAPRETARVPFAAGSAALLINANDREASVQGVIRGDTGSLGMRYVQADGSAAPRDAIKTNLTIPVGEMFVLGGGQENPFTAMLRNDGGATVRISEITAAGDTVSVGSLAPDATTTAFFGAGSTALLINTSDERARVWAEVTGDTNLGMRYVPAEE